jgi:hypothetical protein
MVAAAAAPPWASLGPDSVCVLRISFQCSLMLLPDLCLCM